MAIAEFPTYLIPVLDGYSETVEPVVLRSDFDSGPARQRSYSCGQFVRRSITYSVCGCDKMQMFRDWFASDLRNGSLWFTWTDPCTSQNVRARFFDHSYQAVPDNRSFDSWTVQINLEVWKANA